ncbi:MAG: hypothetical protein HKN90_04710 [Flavobacteriaceae bacterium]|nr:hypothetical protein [Flavobacteriaceae bacterium]
MKMLHSYWAYLALLILIIAVINAISGLTSKRTFKDRDLRISLFTLIVIHIQLVIGLGWYFMSPWYQSMKEVGMGDTMSNAALRFQAIEHPITMLLAIVLITVGWSRHKNQTTDRGKFKKIALFYGLGLVFILSRIPWDQWFST